MPAGPPHCLPASLARPRPTAAAVLLPAPQYRRSQRELDGMSVSIAVGEGRPSRRAASAAQAAIAQTAAFEGQRGMDISPPRPQQQSLAMKVLESLAPQQGGQEAAGRQQHEGSYASDASPLGAANGTPSAGGGTPGEPHRPVELGPYVGLARQAGHQEELKQQLNERFPATRGRSASNTAFRDLFLTLCPGQTFSVSGHWALRWRLLGAAVDGLWGGGSGAGGVK